MTSLRRPPSSSSRHTHSLPYHIYLSYLLFYNRRLDRHSAALWDVWHAMVSAPVFFFHSCFILHWISTYPVLGVTGWRTRNFWAKTAARHFELAIEGHLCE